MRHLIIILIIFGLGCVSCATQKPDINETYVVSMVNLITNPKKFEGYIISVIGYKSITQHNNLFLTKDHAEAHDSSNSINFWSSEEGFYKNCEDRYVRITGRFVLNEGGFFNVENISSIRPAGSGPDCERTMDPNEI